FAGARSGARQHHRICFQHAPVEPAATRYRVMCRDNCCKRLSEKRREDETCVDLCTSTDRYFELSRLEPLEQGPIEVLVEADRNPWRPLLQCSERIGHHAYCR